MVPICPVSWYPEAFIYCYAENSTIWSGATPEGELSGPCVVHCWVRLCPSQARERYSRVSMACGKKEMALIIKQYWTFLIISFHSYQRPKCELDSRRERRSWVWHYSVIIWIIIEEELGMAMTKTCELDSVSKQETRPRDLHWEGRRQRQLTTRVTCETGAFSTRVFTFGNFNWPALLMATDLMSVWSFARWSAWTHCSFLWGHGPLGCSLQFALGEQWCDACCTKIP